MIFFGDWAPGTCTVRLENVTDQVCVANLEGPIMPVGAIHPAVKVGPILYSTSLPDQDPHWVFALANNHTMDFGPAGLAATLDRLRSRGYSWCGAGKNATEARQSAICESNDPRVGFLSCCEAQFGTADDERPGVAEMGPWLYAAIHELRSHVDAVVVSVHAAVEDSPWPSPRIQQFYRSLIQAGASVIHGHHSHIPQGVEAYGNGVIIYGGGNFVVRPASWRDTPNALWSIGVEVDFRRQPLIGHIRTYESQDDGPNRIVIRPSPDGASAGHAGYLEACNRPLANPTLLAALWQETSLRAYRHYAARFLGIPDLSVRPKGWRARLSDLRSGLRAFRRCLTGVCRLDAPTAEELLRWHLMLVCKSHRDSLATALGVLSGELPDLRSAQTQQLANEMMPWSNSTLEQS